MSTFSNFYKINSLKFKELKQYHLYYNIEDYVSKDYNYNQNQEIDFFKKVNKNVVEEVIVSTEKKYTLTELKRLAREKKIKGYYKLSKKELMTVLEL